jgi:hypothetical protein
MRLKNKVDTQSFTITTTVCYIAPLWSVTHGVFRVSGFIWNQSKSGSDKVERRLKTVRTPTWCTSAWRAQIPPTCSMLLSGFRSGPARNRYALIFFFFHKLTPSKAHWYTILTLSDDEPNASYTCCIFPSVLN